MTQTLPTGKTTLPGRVDTLTPEQDAMLKDTWFRLLKVFVQKGQPETVSAPAPVVDEGKKSRWGFRSSSSASSSNKNTENSKDLFLGATKNPQWLSLPLEDAIPMIPGEELAFTFWNMVSSDNADCTVLRFLRARKWDADAALDMLLHCLRWRLVQRVDDITALGEHGVRNTLEKIKPGMGHSFIDNLFSNKAVIGGPDKEGRPIAYLNVRFHRKEDQDHEVLKILCIYFMECSRMIVHQPTETCCLVFNMEGFGLENMDFDFVRFLLQCFEAFYPETLGRCIIHKAPWVFSQVWRVISPMLDPVVATKIFFTNSLDELTEFIDRSVLPPFILGKENIERNKKIPPLPPAGKLLSDNQDSPEYKAYYAVCEQYLYLTFFFTMSKFPAKHPERKKHARMVRHEAIRVEPVLRGRTTFHEIGLADVENNRLILKYFGNIKAIDISDDV
ncbi:CRAL-TRIO domain-containing protein [Gongronella butleri]|nr:CRAL-TRIO domain-containing protein [Gongronella butleri]